MTMLNINQIAKQKPNLVMTDYFFLFAIWLVMLFAIDVMNLRLDNSIAAIKHFPPFFTIMVFILAYIGGTLFKKNPSIENSIFIKKNKQVNSVIFLFAFFVTLGSLYARFVKDIDNGFLTMGIYTMTAPMVAWFVGRSGNPVKLIKGMVFIYLFWALASILMQFFKFREVPVFHSREHLALAGTSILYFLAKSKINKIIVVLFILLSAFVGHKNTAYLVTILLLSVFFLVSSIGYTKSIKDGFMKWMFWFKAIVVVLIVISSIVSIYLYVKSSLPTGNPEYRLHTYENAWNKFLSSPIWGNGYTNAATEEFDLYTVETDTQILPTHSDPLDIIANGGLIGFLLWASVLVFLLSRWLILVLYPERLLVSSLVPYLHAFLCLVFSGVLVCTFNPILNLPNNAFIFWGTIGVLIATLRFSEVNK